MAGPNVTHLEEEDDDLTAARWLMAIEEGLDPRREAEFHAWLAADPDRAELIARQAALPALARQAQLQTQLDAGAERLARREQARRLANEQALKSRRRFMLGGAIAAGVAAAGVTALIAPWKRSDEAPEDDFETATGEVRAIQLADTSRVWLDTRTRISARLTRERRDIHLASGRLFVEVAHDAQRPLFVRGAAFEARAVGTAFEATAFADRMGVAVTEGVVRVRAGKTSIDLVEGQYASISPSGDLTTYAVPVIAAWRQRRMVLSDQRLDEALAELSRYFERPLSVADAQLAARRVTLSFSIADLAEEDAARIISNAVEADFVADASGEIVLHPVPRETSSGRPVNPR